MEPLDSDEAGALGRRARRAVPLIAVALTIAVVAGLIYLRPASIRTVPVAVPSPSAPTLEPAFVPAYDFVTPSLGWAVLETALDPSGGAEDFWIFRSDDGARHWKLQQHGSAAAQPGISIAFFDRSHGIVVLGGSFANRTSDGGAHWLAVTLPAVTGAQVTFADPMHGWFAGSEFANGKGGVVELYRTSDGGASWQRLPDPPAGGFSFRSAVEGWGAVQDYKGDGDIYSTWDGGQTWDRVIVPPPEVPPGKGAFNGASVKLVPGKGVIASTGLSDFVSFDHGSTWRELAPLPGNANVDDVAFQDATHWWAMPFGNLYQTADAGRTWHHVTLRLDVWNYHVGVIDARHAWAMLDAAGITRPTVGGSALALTSDGGRTWNYANVPNPG